MNIEFAFLDALQTIRTDFLDGFMVFVSSLADKGAIWILLAVILIAMPKYRRVGIVLACGLVIDLLLCNLLIKPLVARPRPCDVNTVMEYLIERPHGWSFPSGHTAASFTAAAALFFAQCRLWVPCAVLAALIAFSRLYLYVHFPTDVLGGVVVGIFAGWLGCLLAKRMNSEISHH